MSDEKDPGHLYLLNQFGEFAGSMALNSPKQELRFMKRIGDDYPGNKPPGYVGTSSQEVLRSVIKRTKYVNSQKYCIENELAINLLRTVVLLFEQRAARQHGRKLELISTFSIEDIPTCIVCGHIECDEQFRTGHKR